jgi:hypothetical protein
MSLFSGSARDAPGGGRKAGSAQLAAMHQPVPPGGSVREVLRHVNNGGASKAAAPHGTAAPAAKKRWMGVVDDAPRRPVAPAWNPGGRALPPGEPARGAGAVARGPHLAFRKDYHQQEPAQFVREDKVGVRPHHGVDGLRPDQVPVWEMKQPQKPGPWQPAYPKCHAQNGPDGPFPQGRERLGADRVGPIVEFKQRRVDLRPHAQGHDRVDAHRIGVFPTWPLPAPSEEDAFDPDRPRTVPADPEDRSRAAAPVLNARRSAAVRRLFMALDPRATGKIEIRELLSHMRPQAFRKRLDFFGRDGVLVSPDDLDEQLSGMLTSLIQKQSKDVRLQTAFMPSGTGKGCRTGRMGNLTGKVSLLELQDVYAALGCHIHDDRYFEEILENTWEITGEPRKEVGRASNGLIPLEYLDVNGNMR